MCSTIGFKGIKEFSPYTGLADENTPFRTKIPGNFVFNSDEENLFYMVKGRIATRDIYFREINETNAEKKSATFYVVNGKAYLAKEIEIGKTRPNSNDLQFEYSFSESGPFKPVEKRFKVVKDQTPRWKVWNAQAYEAFGSEEELKDKNATFTDEKWLVFVTYSAGLPTDFEKYGWVTPKPSSFALNDKYTIKKRELEGFAPEGAAEIITTKDSVTLVSDPTQHNAFISEWTTFIKDETDPTPQVTWNEKDQDPQSIPGIDNATIGLDGAVRFTETLTVTHDKGSHLYIFTTKAGPVTLKYDPKTKVPIDSDGKHTSGDITLKDEVGTVVHVNPIDGEFIINDHKYDLPSANAKFTYEMIVPIKELKVRSYRQYGNDKRLSKNEEKEVTGCSPHTYRVPSDRGGKDVFCEDNEGKEKDHSNTYVNDKDDSSHNFTAQKGQPTYGFTYQGTTYEVYSQPKQVRNGSCTSADELTIDEEGFIEFFDESKDFMPILSKDKDKFFDLHFELQGLVSNAASYTQVDTWGEGAPKAPIEFVKGKNPITYRTHASVEASYAHEPMMDVKKETPTQPVAKTKEGVDVFKPGTKVSIEATMKNTGSTDLTDIEFTDSTGGQPPVDFTQRLDGKNLIKGRYYDIKGSDGKVNSSGTYDQSSGVLKDTAGNKITVKSGETLVIYGVLTMNIADPNGMHGDEIRFRTPGLNGTDSYRALADEPGVIIQKVTSAGPYEDVFNNIAWDDCSYSTAPDATGTEDPAGSKCWRWKDNLTATLWEADGDNRLLLHPIKKGNKYFAPEQPVSMIVTNTGKSPLTDLVIDDTTTNDKGGVVDWTQATVQIGKATLNKDNKILVEQAPGITAKLAKVDNPGKANQKVHVSLMKNGKEYPFNPARFNDKDEMVAPGEFVIITGKLPQREITDGSLEANRHSNKVQAQAISTKSNADVITNINDWNTETLTPRIAVKKYSGDEWADPTGKPGDAQDINHAVEIPLEKYNENGQPVTKEQDVKILVTNTGNDNLSYFSISDESVSSVNGKPGDWTTQPLSCKNTANPEGGEYVVEMQQTGDHKGEYKVSPAFAPGHSIRCETRLPALTFDAGFEPWHSNTVTVEGFGEKSKVKTNKDEDPWHAKALPAKVEIIKYSGQYHDSNDKHTLGNATEDANTDAVAIYADLNDGFKPNDKKVYYTIKNTGFDDLVKVHMTDGTLAETVTETGQGGDATEPGWVIDAVTCNVDAYSGVTPPSDAVHIAKDGKVTIDFAFTNEAPFKIGDTITCESTLKYEGEPLTLDDLIWHADRATVSGNGKKNPELETPEDDDPWNAYSAVPDVQIIKYIGPWGNDLKWDGTKRGDLPDGDSDTAVKRGPQADKQKSVFAQPHEITGTFGSTNYAIKDQEVGFTIRNTGKSELDTLIIEDYSIKNETSFPTDFETGPLTCEAGKGGLHKDATVTVDKDNQKKVKITFTEKNLYLPGQVFTCHTVLSGTTIDPLKGAVHADEVSVVGFRRDKKTKKSTDPAHSYSTAPTIELKKDSIDNDGATFIKRAGTQADPDRVKPMKTKDRVVGQPVPIRFTITTAGMDPLTLSSVKVTDRRDKATEGSVTFDQANIDAKIYLKDGRIFPLQATIDKCPGESKEDCSVITFVDQSGTVTLLSAGDTITYQGTLGETPATSMTPEKIHHDIAKVEGVGEESKLKVRDEDDYYAKTIIPDSRTDKYSNIPGRDETKKEQLKNNTCDGGAAGKVCEIPDADGRGTSAAHSIFMDYTNTGDEALTKVRMSDTTMKGVDLHIAGKGIIGTLDAERELVDSREVFFNTADKLFYNDEAYSELASMNVGETLRMEGTIPEGGLDDGNHANTVKFDAVGVESDFPTEDDDPYESTWKKPEKPSTPPSTEPSTPPSTEPPTPDSRTDKYSNIPGRDETKKEQLKNNTCDGGAAGKVCEIPDADGRGTSAAHSIFMDYTNTGDEALTKVRMSDTTMKGVDLHIAGKGIIGTLDAERELVDSREVFFNTADKLFYNDEAYSELASMNVGETLRMEGTIPEGGLDDGNHANTVKFDAVGVESGKPTEDDDPYESTWHKPDTPPSDKPDDKKPVEKKKVQLSKTGSSTQTTGVLALVALLGGVVLVLSSRRKGADGK
ncbi:MAG: LPXTG cell wall anchor domain-containing protein [Actinomycetaceae bacterium]|nr:LPXTG cell wall anchor domain-containing protein [Actinomycetaceae bacterium]